ncbi:MAG: crotonase/enoyl-CoA hydratase family protein [Acidimicrobiaceae bacterium]|nr:crotonase/enoyl-CoA hydratase family protein [Acidimicrobiaceae bacterium]
MTDPVLRHREGAIDILTLNRPDARNAIDVPTMALLSEALDEAAKDSNVRVVVLTGAGDRVFSAGMDLKGFARGEVPVNQHGFAGITRRNFPKPLIGAANGSAFAGGFEVLLSCDLIVAAVHAHLGLPEPQRGLVAGGGGLVRLPRRIPRALALEMILTGEPVSATRAYEIGLVNRVVDSGAALLGALEIAELIVRNAPLSVTESLRVARQGLESGEEAAWGLSNQAFERIVTTHDALEGAVSFAEKRPAQWQGR